MFRFTLFLLCSLISLPYSKAHSAQKASRTQAQHTQSEPTPVIVEVVRDQKSTEETNEESKKDNRNFWLTFGVFAAAAVQAGAATWGIFIYRKQSVEMSLQREEMSKQRIAMETQSRLFEASIDASSRSADAAIIGLNFTKGQSRARVSVVIDNIERVDHPRVNFKIISHGPTHALVRKAISITTFMPVRDYEWLPEAYGSSIDLPSVFSPAERDEWGFLFQGDRIDELFRQVEAGDMFLHFRVKIDYSDVFGDNHITCVAKVFGRREGMLSLLSPTPIWEDGPEEYNYST